jgi:hypothetical protein
MHRGIAAALALEAVVLGALLTIALDMYAHKRVETLGGVNIWGYRGPVMRQRAPNEIRIAIVGGEYAFGWGVAASETLAPNVRRLVALETDRRGKLLRPVEAVNLGAMGLPPRKYAAWIERFAYLQPDVVCLVVDPRRHVTRRRAMPDRQSAVFTAFGYAPMLPLVLEEKGTMTGWSAVRLTGSALAGVDRALSRFGGRDSDVDVSEPEGPAAYVDAIAAAARSALSRGARVVVVAPTYADDGDAADHEHMAAAVLALERETGRIRFVDLGDEPDMYEDGLRLDGFSFGAGGHSAAAELVTPAVLDLLRVGS